MANERWQTTRSARRRRRATPPPGRSRDGRRLPTPRRRQCVQVRRPNAKVIRRSTRARRPAPRPADRRSRRRVHATMTWYHRRRDETFRTGRHAVCPTVVRGRPFVACRRVVTDSFTLTGGDHSKTRRVPANLLYFPLTLSKSPHVPGRFKLQRFISSLFTLRSAYNIVIEIHYVKHTSKIVFVSFK